MNSYTPVGRDTTSQSAAATSEPSSTSTQPSTTIITSTQEKSDAHTRTNTTGIGLGAGLGGGLVVLLLAALVTYWCTRHRRPKASSRLDLADDDPASSPAHPSTFHASPHSAQPMMSGEPFNPYAPYAYPGTSTSSDPKYSSVAPPSNAIQPHAPELPGPQSHSAVPEPCKNKSNTSWWPSDTTYSPPANAYDGAGEIMTPGDKAGSGVDVQQSAYRSRKY